MSKNVEINYKNEGGGYEVLYPSTTPSQAGSLSIGGGTLTGPLMLSREPVEEMEAVNLSWTKNYISNQAGSTVFGCKQSIFPFSYSGRTEFDNYTNCPLSIFDGKFVSVEVKFDKYSTSNCRLYVEVFGLGFVTCGKFNSSMGDGYNPTTGIFLNSGVVYALMDMDDNAYGKIFNWLHDLYSPKVVYVDQEECRFRIRIDTTFSSYSYDFSGEIIISTYY